MSMPPVKMLQEKIIHSDKKQVHEELDGILKDADVMQHWLRNPLEKYFFSGARSKLKDMGVVVVR